jgi:hypothetical protein
MVGRARGHRSRAFGESEDDAHFRETTDSLASPADFATTTCAGAFACEPNPDFASQSSPQDRTQKFTTTTAEDARRSGRLPPAQEADNRPSRMRNGIGKGTAVRYR